MRLFSFRMVAACLVLAFATLTAEVSAQTASASKVTSPTPHPDFSGVWFMVKKVQPNLIAPEDAPMTPWARVRFADNRKHASPSTLCFPAGVTGMWLVPAPFEIIPLRGRILVFYEHEHMVRQIYMAGEHPKDLIPSWMGNSIARWEGDTLVVDTIGFNDITWLDLWGLPHSDGLHIIERIRLASPKLLEVKMTIEDPKAYTRTWAAVREFDRKPDWKIGEEVCEENNSYLVPSDKANQPQN